MCTVVQDFFCRVLLCFQWIDIPSNVYMDVTGWVHEKTKVLVSILVLAF